MKKTLCLLSLCVMMNGCSSMQNNATTSGVIDHLATAGSLNCKSNELCPNVVVEWDKQQKDKLKLDVVLNSTYEYYDMKGITFWIDGKSFNYGTSEKTEQKYINRLIPKRSSNVFVIPSLFLYEFKNANNVDLSIETDKGVIKRSVYTPTQKSTLYQNFSSLIAGLPDK
ncbi:MULTISPECIES: hypothetical protein [unclassified Acinetobacter]|uniref:Lipoprotein n=1 Tax=Acinetobacter corruptisaponis TaxID=3045147 RepID=A0ABY8S3K8_9GAMM|nr:MULTISPECIES: hypothetical protein [unclassified Acinetobacter]MDH0032068.1 hypothetical protein [Acinetobacter sp. GD04021]MDH0887724.1 hypothetical protein [Acinetobacter sp. GD03873]MDH1084072.1 hypothetical protein [Acinetobacter sp. GD03983]MDH2191001.1 hypothetical protein [Acinetobacter sp. GD03645]MDH2204584.1 hypothetical protein [Acinetobacter sp. GD03647]